MVDGKININSGGFCYITRRKMDRRRKAFIGNLFGTLSAKGCPGISGHAEETCWAKPLPRYVEAEMDDHLGYSSATARTKKADDSRNGYGPENVTSSMGSIDLDIPRDEKFEPQIVKKSDRYLK